jgi:hypothetical protein
MPPSAHYCPALLPYYPAGTLKSGDYTYTGEWVDDEMHGQGKFCFASGACYEGCWEHNKYQGQGRYTFPDGKAYQVRRAEAFRKDIVTLHQSVKLCTCEHTV